MHESLDEFQFRLDTTIDSRVICPCASEKSMYEGCQKSSLTLMIKASNGLDFEIHYYILL